MPLEPLKDTTFILCFPTAAVHVAGEASASRDIVRVSIRRILAERRDIWNYKTNSQLIYKLSTYLPIFIGCRQILRHRSDYCRHRDAIRGAWKVVELDVDGLKKAGKVTLTPCDFRSPVLLKPAHSRVQRQPLDASGRRLFKVFTLHGANCSGTSSVAEVDGMRINGWRFRFQKVPNIEILSRFLLHSYWSNIIPTQSGRPGGNQCCLPFQQQPPAGRHDSSIAASKRLFAWTLRKRKRTRITDLEVCRLEGCQHAA
eukprot:284815629_5